MNHTQWSETFINYKRAVMGSDRAQHTYHRRLNEIRGLAGGFKNKNILDIGCGFGFRTVGIAESGAARIIGIDTDDDRIREAGFFARSKELDNVDFRKMDAAALQFEPNTFDLVIADEMIHHIEHLPSVAGEVHRVLKHNGIAIISDHNRLSLPSELIRTIYFGREKERVFTANEVKEVLAKADFGDIVYKHIIFTIPFSNVPQIVLQINYALEALIEKTPVLRSQCAVYVIRGIKH